MDIIAWEQIRTDVKCGKYDCLKNCSCDTLTDFAGTVRTMSEAEIALLIKWICAQACATGPSPGGPGHGGGEIGIQDCLDQLSAYLCTEDRQTALVVMRAIYKAIRATQPAEPVLTMLDTFDSLASALQTFCSNPRSPAAEAAMAVVCATSGKVSSMLSQAKARGGLSATVAAAAEKAFTPELQAKMAACCAAGATAPATNPVPEPPGRGGTPPNRQDPGGGPAPAPNQGGGVLAMAPIRNAWRQ